MTPDTVTTKTTIRLTIKGVDHDLTPDEAKSVIAKLQEAVNEKPLVIIREVERLMPRQREHYPNPPFGWPSITCKLGAAVRAVNKQVITGEWKS